MTVSCVSGAGVGLVVNVDRSVVDAAKDGIKKGLDWLQSKFW
jgi:hypothetical protein